MDTHANADVNARLDRLEREVRRWRRAAVVAGGLPGFVALIGATTPKTAPVADEVRARRFIVVDEAGRELGRFGVGRKLWDATWPALTLSFPPDDRSVSLDPSGLRITDGSLKVVLNNRRLVAVNDPLGKLVPAGGSVGLVEAVSLWFGFDGREDPSLALRGRLPRVVLGDEQGGDRAVLGHTALAAVGTGTIEQRPTSSLVLFDRDSKVLFKAP